MENTLHYNMYKEIQSHVGSANTRSEYKMGSDLISWNGFEGGLGYSGIPPFLLQSETKSILERIQGPFNR